MMDVQLDVWPLERNRFTFKDTTDATGRWNGQNLEKFKHVEG
jgi:hypothetical protein